jgi:RNA polymerase sigma-70 factor (ECF subfamily)
VSSPTPARRPDLTPSSREAAELEGASDGELIQRISVRDHDAFEALYRRHARRVFAIAFHKLNDRGRAEDATQETFAAIWRHAATYRSQRGPGTPWLNAIARNAIIDRARARHEQPTTELLDIAHDGPGPAQQAENAWVRQRVHQALEQLTEPERTLITLAYWKGLSQTEIANHLNIPLGTVKTRTRNTLARLADILEQKQLL